MKYKNKINCGTLKPDEYKIYWFQNQSTREQKKKIKIEEQKCNSLLPRL